MKKKVDKRREGEEAKRVNEKARGGKKAKGREGKEKNEKATKRGREVMKQKAK